MFRSLREPPRDGPREARGGDKGNHAAARLAEADPRDHQPQPAEQTDRKR